MLQSAVALSGSVQNLESLNGRLDKHKVHLEEMVGELMIQNETARSGIAQYK